MVKSGPSISWRLIRRWNELLFGLRGNLEAALGQLRVVHNFQALRGLDSEGVRVVQKEMQKLESLMNMPPEERARLERELEVIEFRLGIKNVPQLSHLTEDELRLIDRRFSLSSFIEQAKSAKERAGFEQERAEIDLHFGDRLDWAIAAHTVSSLEDGDLRYGDWRPSTDEEWDLLNRYNDLNFGLSEIAVAEWNSLVGTQSLYAENEPYGAGTLRAKDELRRLEPFMDLTLGERNHLEREFQEIRYRLDVLSTNKIDTLDEITQKNNNSLTEGRGTVSQSTQDKLDAYVKRHHDIMMELDDNLNLSEEERRSLAQEYEKLGRAIVSLEEELRREEPLEGEQYGRQTVSQGTSDEQYRLTDEEIRLLDRRFALPSLIERTRSAEERAALERELAAIEQQFGDRLTAADAAYTERMLENSYSPHDDAQPEWRPSTDEERRMSARYSELMYALHGMVEEDLRGLEVTYDFHAEENPDGEAARRTLAEIRRLEAMVNMSPEERTRLEEEAGRIGAELKRREEAWRASLRGDSPNPAPNRKDRFQRSQDAQAAFVASFAETMRNIAAQGGMSGDMAARSLPYSAVSGHEFSGANMALLMLKSEERGYTDDRWLTFEQLQKYRRDHPDEKVHIRAGEKGTTVLTSRWVSYVEEGGERRVLSPEEVLDNERQKSNGLAAPEVKKALLYTPYTVFNAQQIEGFPAKEKERPAMSQRDRRELVDRFVAAAGIELDYTAQRSPSRWDEKENRISMSGPHLFQRMGNFLLQKLRETFRAFGHESRENSPLYAGETLKKRGLEEMRAEILGMLAGRYLGIERDTGRMAQHVGLWDQSFGKKDTRSLFRAVTDAGKVLSLLHQFAEGETPKAKWFPPKEAWEENFRATEYKELKAMMEFVGEELRMQRGDNPAPHPQLGESILRAVEREAPLDELRDKLKEAWPVLANAPHLVTVGLAESAAKYLPEGMFEREREKVVAMMDGARRMQQQTREQGAAAEAPQEAPVQPVAAAQPEPPTKTEIREQALKAFDNMSDDTVTRVRMLLRDPDFLKAALKDDPECARDLASLCDNVSTALHAELEEMKQREHDTPAPQASSPAPRMR